MTERQGSRAEVAELLGVSERRISQLVRDGRLGDGTRFPSRVVGRGRSFPLAGCLAWYARFKTEEARARTVQVEPVMHPVVLRKATADAALAEFRLRREQGLLIAVEDAEAEVSRFCNRVRAGILSMRSRYQAELVGLQTIAEAGLALERIAAALLTDLQDDAGGAHDVADLEPAEAGVA